VVLDLEDFVDCNKSYQAMVVVKSREKTYIIATTINMPNAYGEITSPFSSNGTQ
jgi:hypothetical protein